MKKPLKRSNNKFPRGSWNVSQALFFNSHLMNIFAAKEFVNALDFITSFLSSGVFTCDIYSMVRSTARAKAEYKFCNLLRSFCWGFCTLERSPYTLQGSVKAHCLRGPSQNKVSQGLSTGTLWADSWMNAQLCCKLLTCCVVIASLYLSFPRDYELLVRGI